MKKMKILWFLLCIGTCIILAPPVCAQQLCPAGVSCVTGQDPTGAFFIMAVPPNYNHQLILWAHGYRANPPSPLGVNNDGLGPAVFMLGQGFAVAASSFRPNALGMGGWMVKDGAEDTESLRQRFVQTFGRPDKTFLMGASEGGLITVDLIERFARGERGELNYDGALCLCAPLAGATANWNHAFDLRVVYQYYCKNLPRADEEQYPLYLGLALDNVLSRNEVSSRVNECTGVLQPAATRSAEQAQNLSNILSVIKIPESSLILDMTYATFDLQELSVVRTHGLSPVTNLDVQYTGSSDDQALNSGVFRAGAVEEAAKFLKSAYDPTGRIKVPILTMHTIGDGTVFVENENAYHDAVEDHHRLKYLQQNYTTSQAHCGFTFSELLGSGQALLKWVYTQQKPTRAEVQNFCQQNTALFKDSCNLDLDFEPKSFASRVPDRPKGVGHGDGADPNGHTSETADRH